MMSAAAVVALALPGAAHAVRPAAAVPLGDAPGHPRAVDGPRMAAAAAAAPSVTGTGKSRGAGLVLIETILFSVLMLKRGTTEVALSIRWCLD